MTLCFVTGLNRSGTTLLHSLLSGHSHIFATDFEDGMISGLARAGSEFDAAIRSGRPSPLLRVLSYYTEYELLRLTAMRGTLAMPGRWGGQERQHIPFDLDFHAFEADFLERITVQPDFRPLTIQSVGDLLTTFYQTLAVHRHCADRPIIASKPGLGADTFLRAAPYLGDLRPMLLCVQRDPRAVISSTLQHLPATPISTLAEDWRRDQAAIETLIREGKYSVLAVRYEALVEDPAAVMERVASFLGVPFEDSLLNPEIGGAEFRGNSSFGGQASGISRASTDRWKTALPPAQIREIERRLMHPMQGADYVLTTSPSPASRIDNLRNEWLALKAKIGQHVPQSRTTAAALAFGTGIVTGAALTMILLTLLP